MERPSAGEVADALKRLDVFEDACGVQATQEREEVRDAQRCRDAHAQCGVLFSLPPCGRGMHDQREEGLLGSILKLGCAT